MARRYDSRTTIFSPEGRLFQVEYAMQAISNAGTALGILTKDGIILAAEKKVTSKLLEQSRTSEKIYLVNDNMAVAVAGMTADANTLIQYCRLTAQRYLYQYQEQIPCEQLAQKMCDLKQGYTQHGGLRPYGVSFLYAGYDEHYQFQLYHSDPSGNYAGWKAHCIGANDSQAQSILKQEYKDDMSLKDGVKLAVKVLSKSMETTSLTGEKLEFAIVSAVDTDAGKRVCVKMFSTDEIDQLLKEYKEEKAE